MTISHLLLNESDEPFRAKFFTVDIVIRDTKQAEALLDRNGTDVSNWCKFYYYRSFF